MRLDESETLFFFGRTEESATQSEAGRTRIAETAFAGDSSGIREEDHGAAGEWVEGDISALFPELRVIDEVSAQSATARMERARVSLREAQSLLRAAEHEAAEERARLEATQPEEGWRRLEHQEAIRRREMQIRNRARNAAVAHLVRAIAQLDGVGNPAIADSDNYKELLTLSYRQYVKLQFQMRNFSVCMDVLERYLRLRPEHAQDPEVHRLLAACYRHQQTIAARTQDYRMSEEFRRKKNNHLLEYARLAFGAESAEFNAVHQRVERDTVQPGRTQ